MEERLEKNTKLADEKEIERHALLVLRTLGLSWEDLRGKKVLDLGAGDADLGIIAKQKRIDMISLDHKEIKEEKGISYVRGDINKLPFKDNNFDLIISHAAPPTTLVKNKEDIKAKLDEIKRVLKDGGEFRFGPLGIHAEKIFTNEELFTEQEEEIFTRKERINRIKERSLKLLKSIDPKVEENKNNSGGFYLVRK